MDVSLSGGTLRSFYRSIGSLSKVGAEVLIEAVRDSDGQRNGGLTIKAINTARSAFLSVTFKSTSFDTFSVTVAEGTLQTAVYAKHLLAALRTQKVDRVFLSQGVDTPEKISIQLECGRGTLRKTFGVHCITDVAHVRATLDPSTMPIKIAFRPKELGRLCCLTFSRRRKTSPYRVRQRMAPETCFETRTPRRRGTLSFLRTWIQTHLPARRFRPR